MRTTRTPSEQHAVTALLQFLREGGIDVCEIPEITDRPDAAFEFQGKRVAVECRTLTPERVLRMHGVERVEGRSYEIYIPEEPNLWIQRAIEAKQPRIADYKSRSGASECWLVVHSARGGFTNLGELYNSPNMVLFHMAVWQTPHSFDRIYLTGEYDLPPVCIFDRRNELALRPVYEKKKLICIRVRQQFMTYVTATAAPNGEGQISVNLSLPLLGRFHLQPLDKRFRVDYQAIMASRSGESVLASTPTVTYAEPIDGQPQPGYYTGDAMYLPEKVI